MSPPISGKKGTANALLFYPTSNDILRQRFIYTLKMEWKLSSETSVLTRPTGATSQKTAFLPMLILKSSVGIDRP
jgi:hypothetical protein